MGERLTPRQEEVLRLSATMTDKEIGRELGISENTVDKHFREILRRFEVSSRKAALRRLARDASYAPGAVPEPLDSARDRVVGGEPVHTSGSSAFEARLFTRYARLGRWRTPGSLRVRVIAILGWMVLGLIVLMALTGVVSVILEGMDDFAPAHTLSK